MKKFLVLFAIILVGNLSFAFETYRLSNGQTVVIEENHTNPVVTIDTWIKTGSINETDKNNGISHFLEHLFFKGTEKNPYGTFDRVLESKGAINNAATSKDFTHYYITIPSKDFDLALEMHSDMLQNPSIPQDEMEKERLVVLEEIYKDINSPQNKVYNNLMEMMYINHPYKRRVIGSADIVSKLSREDILSYFNTYYAPSNMITIVAGDVNSKEALKKIKQEFNSNCKKTPKNKFEKEKQLPSYLRKVEYSDVQSGYMLIGFRGVPISDRDSYALDVLSVILGEGKSSILYRTIKEEKTLANSIYSSNSTAKDDGIFYISANYTPDKLKSLEEAIFDEIEDLQENGITEQQLKLAKSKIETDTYYARESVSDIAQEIGYTFVTTGGVDFYNTYTDNIKKVSISDVNRVLKKYLGKNKAAVSILLPKGTPEVEISHKKHEKISADFVSENLGTQKYLLSNGATLLITPNKTNKIIGISIFAKGGEFLEPKAGTGSLMSILMTKSTKKYTETELANKMEEDGIKIIPLSGADAFKINVLTTKDEYKDTLKLLNEIVNNALFKASDIEKVKKEQITLIKAGRDLPLKRAVEEFNTMIYKGSVYSNTSKILEHSYPAITREDILKYYSEIFEPKNLVISVNGDVDEEYTASELTKIFPKRNMPEFSYKKYSIPTVKSRRISQLTDKTTETDWIFLGWQTDGLSNAKDYAALQVIDSLLGTGMSSRLFINLREKEGLAYQLGTTYSPNMLRGKFVAYIGTNPKNLTYAQKKLFDEINRLKYEEVKDQELQEAKDKLLGQFLISQETNLEKAMLTGHYESTGRGYDFKNSYIKMINEVTKTDIIRVAKKYFNENYVLSIIKK